MIFRGRQEDAVQIVLNMDECSTEQYAVNLLAIFNNVREDSRLISVKNNSQNDVYVTCKPEATDDAVEWLSQFGEIKGTHLVSVTYLEEPEFDDTHFDKYYDDIVAPYFE